MRYWKDCNPPENIKNTPIFINCRDKVTPLTQLVNWLLAAGYSNIVLLDNDSTYPPLLNYYNELSASPCIRIVMLNKNLGHTALWDSNILRSLHIETSFVYTDSDIIPIKECPVNVLEVWPLRDFLTHGILFRIHKIELMSFFWI